MSCYPHHKRCLLSFLASCNKETYNKSSSWLKQNFPSFIGVADEELFSYDIATAYGDYPQINCRLLSTKEACWSQEHQTTAFV